MKYITLLIFLALNVSCSSYEPPDYDAIEKAFIGKEKEFDSLKHMIEEDTPNGKCITISQDHIMGWWEYSGLWHTAKDSQNEVSLDLVLSDVGLSHERYMQYLKELEDVGANSGVSHCKQLQTDRIGNVTSTRFGLNSSGLGVSGCTIDIVHRGNKPIPESEEHPGFFYKRVRINENWYIEHGCT